LMTVSTRRSPALCGDTDNSYDVAPPTSPEKMTGTPTGAIVGPAGAPDASSVASPDAGSVVAAAGAATGQAGAAAAPGPSVASPCCHRPPCPLPLGVERKVPLSAVSKGAASIVEGCAIVVAGCAGVVGGATSTDFAGALVLGAGTLTASACGAVVLGACTTTPAACADVVVGGATVVGTCVAALGPAVPPAASNRVAPAASRSPRRSAGERAFEPARKVPARKVVVDAEVVAGVVCRRVPEAAICAWWTA
jgi:hypothetical protein